MNPVRIGVGVVVLTLAAGVAAWVAGRPQTLAPRAPEAVVAVMDIGDPLTRRALGFLVSNKAGHFNGEWLGHWCGFPGSGERYVLTRSNPLAWTRESALFQIDGDGGRFHFDAQPITPRPEVRLGRAWPLDAEAVAQFHRLLGESRYPAQWPAGLDQMCSDAGTDTFESCVDGRYYGVVRDCELPDQGLAKLADRLEALMARGSGGETARQSAVAARALRAPVVPPTH